MAVARVVDGGVDCTVTFGSMTGTQTTFTSAAPTSGAALATTRPWSDYVSPAGGTTIVVPNTRLVSVV